MSSIFNVKYLRRENLVRYALALIVASSLIYLFAPTLKIPLLSDDHVWLFDILPNENIHAFIKGHFSIADREYRYRPLMPTVVRFCYEVFGNDPFCMHLAGFILHFLNTFLVGYLGYILVRNKWMAGISSFFFAVYFAHVENVVWVSDMGNLLSAFFMLITAILFSLSISNQKYSFFSLSLVTFILAMMSKESALTLGLILAIWGGILFWRRPRPLLRRQLAIAMGSYLLLTGLYVFLINRTGFNFALSGTSNYSFRLDLFALGNAFYYPLNFIWPTDFVTLELIYQNLYDIGRTHTGGWSTATKIIALPNLHLVVGGTLFIWVGIFWLCLKRHMIDWFALTWIVLGILPVIFIGGHSERHLYIASIGLSLLFGSLFQKSLNIGDKNYGLVVRAGIMTIFVILLGLNVHWSHNRIQRWQIAGNTSHQVVSTVTSNYPDLPPGSELWFINLPDELNGIHFFRHGISEAIEVELEYDRWTLTSHRISSEEQLPSILTNHQYVFRFENDQLIDLTSNYRSQ